MWAATGRAERGGLNIWRPYEHLDWDTQETLLHAAATALHLAAEGKITACGRLASAIQPPRDQYVYDGDRPDPWRPSGRKPSPRPKRRCSRRTDRDTAHQLLTWLTIGCRTPARFEEQRAYLFGAGIPADFLPTAHELGRVDLV